ncbi:MAG: hypothetical protein PF440_11900 [Thiomicrorhabdus sp.]|jgi:hypothetical protein|nr:hypothetical protein [Thiomicrorhabdus sp.]
MPVCYQLTRVGEDKPSMLQDIDSELWEKFSSTPEPENNDKWFLNWHNTVGMLLAMGKTFKDIRRILDLPSESVDDKVLTYLETNYTSNSWREFK